MKSDPAFILKPSENPPGNMQVSEVPMFFVVGFDDNSLSGLSKTEKQGISFITDLYASFSNPIGNNNPKTFDGTKPHFSFYVNTKSIQGIVQNDSTHLVKRAWKNALKAGHEIGNHTHSHRDAWLEEFSVDDWKEEINLCSDILAKPYNSMQEGSGMGVKRQDIIGFRTPFLRYNQNTFTTINELRYKYDCSLLSGDTTDNRDGTNYIWPFHLPLNMEINDSVMEKMLKSDDIVYSNVLEIPNYYLIVPPDSSCLEYGVKPGFRNRLIGANDSHGDNIKIPGADWNLFYDYGLTKEEALAVLKYSIDLRVENNRCPFSLCFHGDIYVDEENPYEDNEKIKTTAADRREFLKELFEYLKKHDEIRVVSLNELYEWLKSPSSL